MAGADVTADFTTFRGLALPARQITELTFPGADTSVTQAGPWAGEPQPGQSTSMELRARGPQTADTTINVATQLSGFPGTGTVRHKMSTDASDEWRGHNMPMQPDGGTECWQYDSGSGSLQEATDPSAVTLSDGAVVCVVQQKGTAVVTSAVYAYVRNPSTGAVSSVSVGTYPRVFGANRQASPCLVLLPNDRLLCFAFAQLASGDMQVRMWVSDDLATTWTLANKRCLPAALEYNTAGAGTAGFSEFRRLRAAYKDGQILLIAAMEDADNTLSGSRDVMAQYASRDLGSTFYSVAAADGTNTYWRGRYQDIVVAGGYFHVFWVADIASSIAKTYHSRIGSAFEALTSFNPTSLPNFTSTVAKIGAATENTTGSYVHLGDGYLAACVDENGYIYLFVSAGDTANSGTFDGLLMVSFDNGQLFQWVGRSSFSSEAGTWWANGDSATHPTKIAAVWQRGRVLILHNFVTDTATHGDSLYCTYLGSHTNVTAPEDESTADTSIDMVGIGESYRPYEDPANVGFTQSSSGTFTESLVDGKWVLTTTVGTVYYTKTFDASTTATEGVGFRIVLPSTSGGATGSDEIALRLRLADASSYDWYISIRITGSDVRMWDHTAGAAVITASVDPTVQGIEVYGHFAGADAIMAVRQYDTNADHFWTDVQTTSAITDGGATANANSYAWGHFIAGTAASHWVDVDITPGGYLGDGLTGFSNPTSLRGLTLASAWQYLIAGVSIRADDGPTYGGDTWTIATRYAKGIEKLDPLRYPSPQQGWEATGETQQDITADMDPTSTTAMTMATDVLVVGHYGFKGRTGTLYYQVTGGGYTSLGTFDRSDGYALSFTRKGAALVPGASGDTPFLQENMCEGWYAEFGNGDVREVRFSTGGLWTNGTQRQASIVLKDIDDGEPTTGTVYLYPPNTVMMVPLLGVDVRAVKVVFDAQDVLDGTMAGGTQLIGSAYLFGEPYSRERNISFTAGVDEVTGDDGISYATNSHAVRRTWEFGWTEGVYLKRGQEAAAEPDYFAASTNGSALPVGNMGVTPLQVMGIHGYLHGRLRPAIYLPRVPKMTTGITMFNHPDDHALVTITSNGRFESALGNENAAEFARTGTVILREVI